MNLTHAFRWVSILCVFGFITGFAHALRLNIEVRKLKKTAYSETERLIAEKKNEAAALAWLEPLGWLTLSAVALVIASHIVQN